LPPHLTSRPMKLISNSTVIMVSLTLLSCSKLPKPEFSYFPEDNPEAGDSISFTNKSRRADAFLWEFGDGETSTNMSPLHVFQTAGNFDVTLNATNDAGDNLVTQPITINEPTVLGFVVYDSTMTQLLPGANIWVYDNETDRDSLIPPSYSGFTDSEGKADFWNLEPIVYHVWISRTSPGGFWTYKGYTFALKQNKVNYYTVPCTWSSGQEVLTW
jgi:PKD repeat protein